MSDRIRQLEELVESVKRLVDEERWDELSALDDSARGTVEQAATLARGGSEDQDRVRTLIEELLGLYDRARVQAEQARDEAERTLKETSKTQRAANAYLNNQ